MTVYLVGAGPGDPGLLTVRAAEVLAQADVVVYDRLSIASLLDLAPPHAERISVGKTPREPSTPQEDINALLIERGQAGQAVVRLKGGDPFVFARGGEEALALQQAQVPFEIVPGISSSVAVPAYAGVPVTHRGLATSFTVVTGHEDPWAATETDWSAVAAIGQTGGTIVVLMGVATRGDIAARLMDGGLDGSTPATAVQWGTRAEQRTVRTTLGGLGAAEVGSPSVIVIGAVAGLDLGWYERRPLFGCRVVTCRPRGQAGRLSSLLRDQGAEVSEVPAIEIAPPGDGGEALGTAAAQLHHGAFDWVAFTSANAVDALFSRIHDARALGRTSVAAVGPGTAAALRHRGVVAELVPERNTADGLVDALARSVGPSGVSVLLPQAAGARDAAAKGLSERGWKVQAVEAYRTVARPLGEAELVPVDEAWAAAFTSASTVDSLVAAGGRQRLARPSLRCVAIGPETAAALTRHGIEPAAVADPHNLEGLVAALIALAARDSGH